MFAQLKFNQGPNLELFLDRDAEGFEIVLQEPESSHETLYFTPFSSFLSQEELEYEIANGHLRNQHYLKGLAKKLMEERIEIRTLANDEQMSDTETHYYTFDIVLARDPNN